MWPSLSSYVLWFLMAALLFLAFDARNRDENARINEVLDSRPLSNLSLLAGRLAAAVAAVLVSLLGALLLVQVAGTLGPAFGWHVFPIEPVAILTFVFVDTIPALVAWCALLSLLAVVVPHRLAVTVGALALLGLTMWVYANAPNYLLPAISPLHINDNWASDLAPRYADAETLLQRGSMLLIAAGWLLWAAALHKRTDGVPPRGRGLRGALLVGLGTLGIGALVVHCIQDLERRAGWLQAHQQAIDMPTAFVRHIEGEIGIDPGRRLNLDLVLRIETPVDGTQSPMLFSFNPGLRISDLRLDNLATPYEHESGLLRVELPDALVGGSPTTLQVRAAGVPDADFAYLDSIVEWRVKSSRNRLLLLGTAAGIFERSYVALTPALRWLPFPGPNLAGASRGHSPTIDLTVSVPENWLVAGIGRREAIGNGRFRFRPGAAVPEVGIFAARFERRAIRVADVELELLLEADHWGNLATLADTRDQLEAYLKELISRPKELGMGYPYDGFAVVEVPSHLREYAGGWALDTALEMPGLLLLKEHWVPFANYRQYEGGIFAGYPGGAAELKAQTLKMGFTSAYHSVDILQSLSRHTTSYQMQASGLGASALNGLIEDLGRSVLAEVPSIATAYFNVHQWDVEDRFARRASEAVHGLLDTRPPDRRGFGIRMELVEPATWERILGASLADLNMNRDPAQAKAALRVRVEAAARTIREGLGMAKTSALLATLRKQTPGWNIRRRRPQPGSGRGRRGTRNAARRLARRTKPAGFPGLRSPCPPNWPRGWECSPRDARPGPQWRARRRPSAIDLGRVRAGANRADPHSGRHNHGNRPRHRDSAPSRLAGTVPGTEPQQRVDRCRCGNRPGDSGGSRALGRCPVQYLGTPCRGHRHRRPACGILGGEAQQRTRGTVVAHTQPRIATRNGYPGRVVPGCLPFQLGSIPPHGGGRGRGRRWPGGGFRRRTASIRAMAARLSCAGSAHDGTRVRPAVLRDAWLLRDETRRRRRNRAGAVRWRRSRAWLEQGRRVQVGFGARPAGDLHRNRRRDGDRRRDPLVTIGLAWLVGSRAVQKQFGALFSFAA